MMDTPLRVLLVTNHFAPESRASANRMTRFVRLLPAEGIEPAVLTVREQCTQPNDPALLATLPPDLPVTRLPCLNLAAHTRRWTELPGRLGRLGRWTSQAVSRAVFQTSFPDALAAWGLAALPVGWRLVQTFRPQVLLASLPSYTPAAVVALLGAASGLPFVIDYRDSWTPALYSFRLSRLQLAAHGALERRIAARAAALLAVTERHAQVIGEFLGPAGAGKLHVVYNAADLELAAHAGASARVGAPGEPTGPDRPFRLIHAGGISGQRTLEPLLLAIRQLADQGVLDPAGFRFELFGPEPRTQLRRAAELGLAGFVQYRGAVPRTALLQELYGCRLTVAVQGEEFVYGLPSKVLESVALGRPVLGLSPHGSVLEETLRRLGMGENFAFDEVERLTAWLRAVVTGTQALPTEPQPGELERYRPASTVRELARILRQAAGRA